MRSPVNERNESVLEQEVRTIMEEMVVGIKQVIADAQTARDTTYFGFDGELLS
jgi:hypothetical protein